MREVIANALSFVIYDGHDRVVGVKAAVVAVFRSEAGGQRVVFGSVGVGRVRRSLRSCRILNIGRGGGDGGSGGTTVASGMVCFPGTTAATILLLVLAHHLV